MSPSDDPLVLLPFAVAGIIVGSGLGFGCGYGLYQQWVNDENESRSTRHVTLDGRIEWAGWRQSAVAGGPARYLQLRIEGDDRGFLVSAATLPDAYRERLEGAGDPVRPHTSQLSSLVGKQATIVVDAGLSADNPTPYLSALRVEGETIVPLDDSAASPLWKRIALGLLLGLGVLIGGGVLIGSLQHVVVCIRYGQL